MNFSDAKKAADVMQNMLLKHDQLDVVFCVGDPAAIGAPGRIGLLEELLDYIETFDGVWWTTGEEMYDYCLKNQQEK